MKILVTGFEPFGGEAVNPSYEVLRDLPDKLAGAEISKLQLPTEFGRSAEVLIDYLTRQTPDVVLCLGQAGGRSAMTPERVAINVDDASIPDNAGQQPLERPIQPDGETAYFTTLPIKAMVKAMQDQGIPAQVSNTAGTYVCNHIMYQVLYAAQRQFQQLRAGFMHIPYLPEQVADKPQVASLPLETIRQGLIASLEAIVQQEGQDIELVTGQTH